MKFNFRFFTVYILMLISGGFLYSQPVSKKLLISRPEHGFVSLHRASRWEESMLTGNGTIGALVPGNPLDERIILSDEYLFMPKYSPKKAPPIYKYLKQIRELTLNGHGDKAAKLLVRAGKDVGINSAMWTDPFVPACQLEIKSLSAGSISGYTRGVNYETGEATTAWESGGIIFKRKIFFSRADSIGILSITSTGKSALNFKFRLSHLPFPTSSDDGFNKAKLISSVTQSAKNNELYYSTTFKKRWKGSLKGYRVRAIVKNSGGKLETKNGWVTVKGADEINVIMNIKLSYSLPLKPVSKLEQWENKSYRTLLSANRKIQSEMFNRFSLMIGNGKKTYKTAGQLWASSSYSSLNPELVNQLCEAARYTLICSTGKLPPTLQGIWADGWQPAWSSDFTLNGNLPTVISSSLSCNLKEEMLAYLNYMYSNMKAFRYNAWGLYHAPGIFVPSRIDDQGSKFHFMLEYPQLFWLAGDAWTSEFFYDYWEYTHDKEFLKKKVIPFMEASADFYQYFLTTDKEAEYMFIPSYSPENAPPGYYPTSINATMDVASVKQLLRNLLTLSKEGWIKSPKTKIWKLLLKKMPDYEIDKTGDLKEWIWPLFHNHNAHRHASHLYPLFDEIDPEFENQPELREAAKTAIENRLKFRSKQNGGEMAFGLVQLGLSAAHIRDTSDAYECVDWLCNSYWSPSFTSYHNPHEIFNVDICGGLPAVVTEMIIHSSPAGIELLPALPAQWSNGNIRGFLTRCGVKVDFEWKNGKPVKAVFTAERNTSFKLKYGSREKIIKLKKGQVRNWRSD